MIRRVAGIAFFLPGSLAAFLAGPPNLGILGVLFLSVGDAGRESAAIRAAHCFQLALTNSSPCHSFVLNAGTFSPRFT